MITKSKTTSTSKLRLIIAATLLFIFHSSYSQTNNTKVNTGIKINLEKTPTAKPAQDYNSSRSNKPRPIALTNDTIGNDTVQSLIKDYNASRNDYDAKKPKKLRSATPPNSGAGNDSVPKLVQDYNSGRSNKPSPIVWMNDSIKNDTVPTLIQDYNSSRGK